MKHSRRFAHKQAGKRWRALPLLVAIPLTFLIVVSVSAAVALSATKTYTFIGGDGDGKADPGETIEYTVPITNSSGIAMTSVNFSDTIDTNTTLVGGSINVSPLAINDSYDTIGNTLLEVGGAAGPDPAVHVSSNLFTNDAEFLGGTLGASGTHITAHSAPAHGTFPIFDNNTGTFSYLPTAGYTGPDSFTYTVTDAGGLTDTATVTINVINQVWYVKNNAAAGGLGRSTDPFDTLAEAQAASAINDTIYVFQGDGTTAGQNAGITLKNGQHLLGAGVALTVPVSVNGGANPTTLRAAGSQPRVDNTAGNGVSATDSIPAEISGLSLSGTVNAIDVTLTGASTGALAIKNNTIFGAGAEGIDINKGGAGTLTLAVQANTWNAAGTHIGNGFDARTTAGALQLAFSNNTNMLSNAIGFYIDGIGGGTLTVTDFANNTVSGDTLSTGMSATAVTFDAIPGGTFQTVAGGSTAIGTVGNGVGSAGLVLNGVSGDLAFSDLDIVTSNGTGLQASGTVAYTGSAGFQLAVGAGVATIAATNGPSVNLTTVTAALPFLDIDSTNSSAAGVLLTTVLGNFSAGSGSSINNATGTDFSISAGNANVTYDGTMTDTSGRLISVANTTGGTKSFTGALSAIGGTSTGIALTSNTGATISFAGGMQISTGSNDAFTATGGGTVNVCDENPCNPAATGAAINTLTTTTGMALNVANTSIGANNLEFRSISSNGAVNGIVLNNTGTSGGLKVSGTGGAGTGGTIQNSTADAIVMTSTNSPNLNWMSIIDSAGSATDDGIVMTNVTGTVSIANSSITNSPHNGITVDNNNTNMTAFNLTNTTIQCVSGQPCQPSGSIGNDGVLLTMRGTSVLASGLISGSTFSGVRAVAVQIHTNDSGRIGANAGGSISAPPASNSIIVQTNTFTGNGQGIGHRSISDLQPNISSPKQYESMA